MRRPFLPLRKLQWQLSFSYILVFIMTILALLGIGLAALVFRQAPILTSSDQLVQNLEASTLVSLVKEGPPGPSLAQVASVKLESHLLDSMQSLNAKKVVGALILDATGQQIAADAIPGEQIEALAARSQSQAVFRAAFANVKSSSNLAYTFADGLTVAAVPLVDSRNELVGVLFVAVEGLRLETSAPPSLFSSLFATMNVLPFIIALILAIGLSGTLFCILTARRIAHRLRNIAVAVHTWSQGEFQVAIADASADELGLLSGDLNQMALQVQTLLTTRQQLALLEERQRVARDLHDSVKQQTFAVTLLINAARKALDKDLTVAHMYLAEAEELSDQTRQELTVIIQEMRPLALLDRGLIVVLREYIERWSQRNAIAAEVRFQQAEQALSPESEEVLLRVTQEALANIARHSGATQVSVELIRANDQLHLHIRDNGHGFAVANALGKGLGLASMRERVESVQGMLHIESNTSGTRIEACLPSKQACTGASKGER